ncbi:mitochondrial ribonuclease P protein 1 homolog [Pectinophora gossypiella]|uniref:RNA (guanine-9-)-methyltransferase domain-containing protein 1 n=1 Tax=Pectinophora gossypiella TaxID=13191 RepID=A0A1E1WNM8_PECGO|nr:mitochondrial ribonuclease P protein 1 homolog [Pectinophora gossypiella]
MHCIKTLLVHLKHQQRRVIPLQRVLGVKQFNVCRKYSVSQEQDDSEQMIDELCQGDPQLEKKLRILMLEVEVMRQDGRCAPDHLQTRHWKHLMELPSRNQRNNYLIYLFKSEKAKENQKAKKEARRKELELSAPEENKEYPDDLIYSITHQSLFLRIRDHSINMFDNYRALQAMTHGQSIVIDCSYEDNMVNREVVNAAKQMTFVFGDNRIHKDPFNIHLCNVNKDSVFMEQLRRNIPTLTEPWFPMNIHSKSYLDIFPKEKLVYLTPHCREELTTFDPDAVYIIGCMVDKSNNEPLSLAKAKRDGLKMAKLPLDRYLEWGPGSKKNLNMNHMVPILLDLRLTGNWEFALRHIPRRKLMETKILAMQKMIKNPLLKDAVARSMKNLNMKDKKAKSRQSLYYDDERF